MPLEAETHAVHSGMTMPPLAEKACRRSGICIKKEKEGKSKKQAKIAGLNKFLHIYYARVMEVYQQV